ncbi:MAG: hypothetical protein E4H13_07825, partial [Calditrichales bacterium]
MIPVYGFLFFLLLTLNACEAPDTHTSGVPWMESAINKIEARMVEIHGSAQAGRIHRGLNQVAAFWHEQDGDAVVFEDFVLKNYAADTATRDELFFRIQTNLELLDGHMDRIRMQFRQQVELDLGSVLPFDDLFAGYEPAAHISEDFYNNKIAFTVLLNFPLSNLSERLKEGPNWSRRDWAETRLASRFGERIPAKIELLLGEVSSKSDAYISGYNIWMHHLLDENNHRLFPPGLRLLTHWNLRDELKAQYANGKAGFPRQQMIQKVMERIVDQSIPGAVVDNPHLDWAPYTNKVQKSEVVDSERPEVNSQLMSNDREPDTRYQMLLDNFHAQQQVDPYWPNMPTFIERRFTLNREMSEERVKSIFHQLLSSPLLADVAKIIHSRVNRDLAPFDIWYDNFDTGKGISQSHLDKIVAEKYPSPAAFEKDIPNILLKLGFGKKRTNEIASLITVDPARGSGHAWGAQMRGTKAHLRTRVGTAGMDYKGYNIAVHELGHNVEQTISMNNIDFVLLNGVPNNAFTEAFAFVFQNRNLELLGFIENNPQKESLQTVGDYWAACEIAAVSLVDISIWHWMYEHPVCTPAELREATIRISKEVWNTYYAPVLNISDVTLLGIYSHMISYPLYLADYPLGHLIAYQLESHVKSFPAIGT